MGALRSTTVPVPVDFGHQFIYAFCRHHAAGLNGRPRPHHRSASSSALRTPLPPGVAQGVRPHHNRHRYTVTGQGDLLAVTHPVKKLGQLGARLADVILMPKLYIHVHSVHFARMRRGDAR